MEGARERDWRSDTTPDWRHYNHQRISDNNDGILEPLEVMFELLRDNRQPTVGNKTSLLIF
jgi:hypothetical protein